MGLWNVAQCSLLQTYNRLGRSYSIFYPDNGDNTFLRSDTKVLPDYIVSHPRTKMEESCKSTCHFQSVEMQQNCYCLILTFC